MAIKEANSVVSIDYELKEVGSSEVIDSSKGRMPLEFITGKGQLIPGLEAQLVGMSAGDSAKIVVPAKDAYGEYTQEGLQKLPREQFKGINLTEGMTLYGQGADGHQAEVKVVAFDDNEVTIDYNHPLAGKDLEFDVTVVSERDATYEEEATGVVGGYANCSISG